MKENWNIFGSHLSLILYFNFITAYIHFFPLNISFMLPITENILFQTYGVAVEFYNENSKVNESDSWSPMKS